MSADQTLTRNLVTAVPEFAAILEEHVADYDEVLTHVLMADFTRAVISLAEQSLRGDTRADATIVAFLNVVEQSLLAGSPEEAELIAASFLENIDDDSAESRALIYKFGPATGAMLRRMRGEG
jgi:hypothetical protein